MGTCLYVGMCTMSAGSNRDQKRASDPLELKLQIAQNLGPLEEQQILLITEPSLGSNKIIKGTSPTLK